MSKRNKPRVQQQRRASNAITRSSGLGSSFDFGTENAPLRNWLSPLQQDQFAAQLYYTDWAAKKIVTIPVDDMLRDGWELKGLSEEQEKSVRADCDRLGVLDVVRQALRLERLIGGSAILLGVQDGRPADQPLGEGRLSFLNTIPRSRISRAVWEQDPLKPDYGRPVHYMINGQLVHRSRLVLFPGDPLLPVPDASVMPHEWARPDGFGQSVLLPIYDDLIRATGSRQAAFQMVQRASVFLAEMDLNDLAGSKEGQASIEAMRNIINQINLFRGAVIDRQPGATGPAISAVTTQFGSVPELVMSFLQVLSAASDIPATRFLGQAPGGLNATGESDLENYYGRLESAQRQSLVPRIRQILTALRGDLSSVEVSFPPLWSMSELEEADVRAKDVANVTSLVSSGLLSDAEALDELVKRDVLLIVPSGEGQPEEIEEGQAPPLEQTMAALLNP